MRSPTCPFATQRLLGAKLAGRRPLAPTGSCAHSAASDAGGQALGDYFARPETKADAHFFVDSAGTLWQFVPVDVEAWAQVSGNDHLVSFETWDGGHAVPWTDAQVATIGRLLVWLRDEWGVSTRPARSATGPGAGYHSQFAAWNPDRHACPGPARVGQLVQLLDRLGRPTSTPMEDDMPAICVPTWGKPANGRVPWYQLVEAGRRPVVRSFNGAPLDIDVPWTHTQVPGVAGAWDARLDIEAAGDAVGLGQLGDRIVVLCADGGTLDVAKRP